MKPQDEIKLSEKMLKALGKGYGTKVCKDTSPSCVNCQAQWALGFMREHIATLEWSLDQDKKETKKVKTKK
jgi:hypothetical protein